jgi:hypothetical protein
MGKLLKGLFSILFVLAILGAATWGTYWLLAKAAVWLTGLQSELATAIIAAAATVTISLLTLTANRYFERRARIEQDNRLKKVPVYEGVIEMLFGLIGDVRDNKNPVGQPSVSPEVEQVY